MRYTKMIQFQNASKCKNVFQDKSNQNLIGAGKADKGKLKENVKSFGKTKESSVPSTGGRNDKNSGSSST